MADIKRVQLAVPAELIEKVSALATVRGTKTATLIKQVLNKYVDDHSDEATEAVEFVNRYQASLKSFREKKSAD